jgi:hypothetical protein
VTLETTPSSANITPSQSGDLNATLNSCDENSFDDVTRFDVSRNDVTRIDVTMMTQSQHLPPKATSSPLSSMTK